MVGDEKEVVDLNINLQLHRENHRAVIYNERPKLRVKRERTEGQCPTDAFATGLSGDDHHAQEGLIIKKHWRPVKSNAS